MGEASIARTPIEEPAGTRVDPEAGLLAESPRPRRTWLSGMGLGCAPRRRDVGAITQL